MFGPSRYLSVPLLWPLLTPDQSRRRLLAVALWPSLRSLAASLVCGRQPAATPRIDHPVEQRSPLLLRNVGNRFADQVSPGKNAMFPCTSAAFTLSAVSGWASSAGANPPGDQALWAQFLSVASHVCTPASSRQALAALPLPSARGYHRFMSNPCRYSHRGLPPHHIAPMLGAHPAPANAESGVRLS